jgi:type II secretory pathway pseudopilin PulG
MRLRYNNAFTIVEIIVITVVIAILSSLAFISFTNVRQDSRDAARQSNATIVSEALEKYYEKNGEYPSVASIVNSQPANTGTAVASKLSIPEGSLAMPNMPGITTNGIAPGSEPHDNYLVYEASSVEDNDSCQNDVDAGCDRFALHYEEESTEAVKTIESRHASRSVGTVPDLTVTGVNSSTISASWTTVPGAVSYLLLRSTSSSMTSPTSDYFTDTSTSVTGLLPNTEYFFRVQAVLSIGTGDWSEIQSATTSSIAAPTGTITITATMSGTNARGTAGGGTCASGTIERQIRYQTNAGTWQSWVTGSPRDVAATEGYTYTFQARARCVVGGLNGPYAQSVTASVTRSVTAPSGLTITAAMSGTDARGTAGGGTCASGTTIERQIRYSTTNTSTAGTWSSYTSGTPRNVAASEGWLYTFQQQARCVGTNANSAWATSATADVVRPIATEPAPTVTVSTSGSTTTWTASVTSCPSGTTAQYRYRSLRDGGYTTSDWSDGDTSRTNTWNTSSQGYEYTRQIQTRCSTVHTAGAWSATGSAAYLRPIDTPAAPTGFIGTKTSSYQYTWTWTAPSCGSGTRAEMAYDVYIKGVSGNAWWWLPWYYEGWLSSPSANGDYWLAPHAYAAATGVINRNTSDGPIPSGSTTQARAKYVCVNTATGREGSFGPIGTSALKTL